MLLPVWSSDRDGMEANHHLWSNTCHSMQELIKSTRSSALISASLSSHLRGHDCFSIGNRGNTIRKATCSIHSNSTMRAYGNGRKDKEHEDKLCLPACLPSLRSIPSCTAFLYSLLRPILRLCPTLPHTPCFVRTLNHRQIRTKSWKVSLTSLAEKKWQVTSDKHLTIKFWESSSSIK